MPPPWRASVAALQVPFAVRDEAGRERVVCWIDSKATFGDEKTHAKQASWWCAAVEPHDPASASGRTPAPRPRALVGARQVA